MSNTKQPTAHERAAEVSKLTQLARDWNHYAELKPEYAHWTWKPIVLLTEPMRAMMNALPTLGVSVLAAERKCITKHLDWLEAWESEHPIAMRAGDVPDELKKHTREVVPVLQAWLYRIQVVQAGRDRKRLETMGVPFVGVAW